MPDTLIDKYTRRFYEPEEFDFPPPHRYGGQILIVSD